MTKDDDKTLTGADIGKAAALVLSAVVLGILPVYLWSTASDEPVGSASGPSTTALEQRESTTTAETPTTTVSSCTTEPQSAAVTTGAGPRSTDAATTAPSAVTTVETTSASSTSSTTSPSDAGMAGRHVARVSDEPRRTPSATRRDLRHRTR